MMKNDEDGDFVIQNYDCKKKTNVNIHKVTATGLKFLLYCKRFGLNVVLIFVLSVHYF